MYAKKNSGMKVVATLLAIALLIGGVVGGTVAWLIAQTQTVTNTFTVGNITIDLEETVGTEGVKSAKTQAVTNNNFKIVPGATQEKDPVVTVEQGSEKCYVYVCVENNLVVGTTTVGTLDIDTDKWKAIGTTGNKTVYRYSDVVDAAAADKALPVFTTVSYANTITAGDMTTLANKTIVISAYAHQSENLTDGTTTTDAAAMTHFGITSANP